MTTECLLMPGLASTIDGMLTISSPPKPTKPKPKPLPPPTPGTVSDTEILAALLVNILIPYLFYVTQVKAYWYTLTPPNRPRPRPPPPPSPIGTKHGQYPEIVHDGPKSPPDSNGGGNRESVKFTPQKTTFGPAQTPSKPKPRPSQPDPNGESLVWLNVLSDGLNLLGLERPYSTSQLGIIVADVLTTETSSPFCTNTYTRPSSKPGPSGPPKPHPPPDPAE